MDILENKYNISESDVNNNPSKGKKIDYTCKDCQVLLQQRSDWCDSIGSERKKKQCLVVKSRHGPHKITIELSKQVYCSLKLHTFVFFLITQVFGLTMQNIFTDFWDCSLPSCHIFLSCASFVVFYCHRGKVCLITQATMAYFHSNSSKQIVFTHLPHGCSEQEEADTNSEGLNKTNRDLNDKTFIWRMK